MEQYPVKQTSPERCERISLAGHFCKRNRFFAVFLIFAALLIAGFAVSAAWANGGENWLKGQGFVFDTEGDTTDENEQTTVTERDDETTAEEPNDGSLSDPIPEAGTPIVSADLSYIERGASYMINESIYLPHVDELPSVKFASSYTEEPLVLILHTHSTESYAGSEETRIFGNLGDATYSSDAEKNVLAVGREFSETLAKHGIASIHCTTAHDADGIGGSYARAEESIRFFLSMYPSIRYVVDIHRDAVMTTDGSYVRTVTEVDGLPTAQILPVVGSDGNGNVYENWKENLALAFRLRAALNADGRSVCRPVYLKNATYNQEIAPYSLLLEVGTGANSLEEALRAAVLLGEAFANLIYEP